MTGGDDAAPTVAVGADSMANGMPTDLSREAPRRGS